MDKYSDQHGGELGKVLPECIVCKQVPARGIAGGIFIRRRFLCRACEEKLSCESLSAGEYAELTKQLHGIIAL